MSSPLDLPLISPIGREDVHQALSCSLRHQHASSLPVVQAKNLIDICISYYCCITNYYSLAGLKQDPQFYIRNLGMVCMDSSRGLIKPNSSYI